MIGWRHSYAIVVKQFWKHNWLFADVSTKLQIFRICTNYNLIDFVHSLRAYSWIVIFQPELGPPVSIVHVKLLLRTKYFIFAELTIDVDNKLYSPRGFFSYSAEFFLTLCNSSLCYSPISYIQYLPAKKAEDWERTAAKFIIELKAVGIRVS